MKNLSQVFILALLVILFASSCSNIETENKTFANIELEDINVTRIGQKGELQVNFQGQDIVLEGKDFVGVAQKENMEHLDAQTVLGINEAFMGAEKVAQLLDVRFVMSDEPIENGMFIFGIETEYDKKLTLEMFDEEGFAMVANNKFDIIEGSNYKALNVQSLDKGTYNFRLRDDSGKELNRQVTITES